MGRIPLSLHPSTRSLRPSTPACVAQWSQQKNRSPAWSPWPRMRTPHTSHVGASLRAARSIESEWYDSPRAAVTAKAAA